VKQFFHRRNWKILSSYSSVKWTFKKGTKYNNGMGKRQGNRDLSCLSIMYAHWMSSVQMAANTNTHQSTTLVYYASTLTVCVVNRTTQVPVHTTHHNNNAVITNIKYYRQNCSLLVYSHFVSTGFLTETSSNPFQNSSQTQQFLSQLLRRGLGLRKGFGTWKSHRSSVSSSG